MGRPGIALAAAVSAALLALATGRATGAATEAPPGPSPAPQPGPQLQPGAIHLRPFQARYGFYWHGMHAGTITFTLRQAGPGEWHYQSVTEPRGLFRLVPGAAVRIASRMAVDEAGVRPLHFEGYEGEATEPAAVLDFDWPALRVRGHMKADAVDMALRPGVQDDLSIMVSLLHSLEGGNVPQGVSLFDKDGIRDYDYQRTGEATVDTPLGAVAAEIYRSQKKHSPRHNLYWLAPAWDDVPVRAEQHKDGGLEWRMELEALARPPPG